MSGKGLHVLKRRLKEKVDALQQCEEGVDRLVKEKRRESEVFLASEGDIIAEVARKFDELCRVLMQKRDDIILQLNSQMKEILASTSANESEELQERLKKSLKASQALLEVEDKAAFLAKYTSVTQSSEDLLTEAFLFLEENEEGDESSGREGTVVARGGDTPQRFSLALDLSEMVRVCGSIAADVSLPSPAPAPASHQQGSSSVLDDHLSPKTCENSSSRTAKLENTGSDVTTTENSAPETGNSSLATGSDVTLPALDSETAQSTNSSCGSSVPPKTEPILDNFNVSAKCSEGQTRKRPVVRSDSPLPPSAASSCIGRVLPSPSRLLRPLGVKLGQKLRVLVTEVHSHKEFWVQPLSQDLEVMSNEMRAHFSSLAAEQGTGARVAQSLPTAGSYIAAQFSYDNEWYRAKVMDIVHPTPYASPLVRVFYVDYGNQEVLPLARLRPLPPALCALPAQAVCCSLQEPAGTDRVSAEVRLWFSDFVPEQAALLDVMECSTLFSFVVRLLLPLAHLRGSVEPSVLRSFADQEQVSVLHLMVRMTSFAQTSSSSSSSNNHPAAKPPTGDDRGGSSFPAGGDSCDRERSQCASDQSGRGHDQSGCDHDQSGRGIDQSGRGIDQSGRGIDQSGRGHDQSGHEHGRGVPHVLGDTPSSSAPIVAETSASSRRSTGAPESTEGRDRSLPVKGAVQCGSSANQEPKKPQQQQQQQQQQQRHRRSEVSRCVSLDPQILGGTLPLRAAAVWEDRPAAAVEPAALPERQHGVRLPQTLLSEGETTATGTAESGAEEDERDHSVATFSSTVLSLNGSSLPDSGSVPVYRQSRSTAGGEGTGNAVEETQPAFVPVTSTPTATTTAAAVIAAATTTTTTTTTLFDYSSSISFLDDTLPVDLSAPLSPPSFLPSSPRPVLDVQLEDGGFAVAVVTVNSPSEFFVHTPDAGGLLEDLQDGMDAHYNGLSDSRGSGGSGGSSSARLRKDSLCAARFAPGEDSWFRGIVLKWRSEEVVGSGLEYRVHFVDFGDSAWVPERDVFSLLADFAAVPFLAIPLCLTGILPPDEEEGRGEGSEAGGRDGAAEKTETSPPNRKKTTLSILPAGQEEACDLDRSSPFQLFSPSDFNASSELLDKPCPSTLHQSSLQNTATQNGNDPNSASPHFGTESRLTSSKHLEWEHVWSEEAVDFFTSYVTGKVLYATLLEEDVPVYANGNNVVKLSAWNDTLPVKLFDTNGEKEVCINGLLVNKKLAKIDDKSLLPEAVADQPNPLSPEVDTWNPIESHFREQISDYQRAIQTQKEEVIQVCINFNTRRGCHYGDRCRFMHSGMGPHSERKTCKSGSHDLHMTPPLPKPKTWVIVEVITVVNPCIFYAHFPAGRASLLSPSATSGQGEGPSASLQHLTEDMNAHYSPQQHHHSRGSLPAEGEMVAVQCRTATVDTASSSSSSAQQHSSSPQQHSSSPQQHRSDWCRARVLHTNNDTNHVTAFFVDFGCSEEVPEARVHCLPPQFLHLPFQAVECYLAGTTHKPGYQEGREPYRRAVDAFTDLVKDKYLVAFVVSSPSAGQPFHSVELQLYDTSHPSDDVCVNTSLINSGHLDLVESGTSLPHSQQPASRLPRENLIPG